MPERISSLRGYTSPRRLGATGECGVALREIRDLRLHQIVAWPGRAREVAAAAAAALGTKTAGVVGPGESIHTARGRLLRVAPLRWWLRDAQPPVLDSRDGAALDISHSFTVIKIDGPRASELLNRHLSLDLRPTAFPAGNIASTDLHHISVALVKVAGGDAAAYELFIPRGFAVAVWELLLQSAGQFGVAVVD